MAVEQQYVYELQGRDQQIWLENYPEATNNDLFKVTC